MNIHRAARLPVHRGPAAWNAILPAETPSPPLEGDIHVDVAIIGGGFAGLSAARRLRQQDAGLKVAVVSRGHGRRSVENLEVTPRSDPAQSGDEPATDPALPPTVD